MRMSSFLFMSDLLKSFSRKRRKASINKVLKTEIAEPWQVLI